jgi:hypothetical protein
MVNLVAMPVSREKMEKYQNRHTRQIEHAARQWEAKANKVSNANNRRKFMERQNNANYRNEFDRVRGELSRYRIPFGSKPRLESRRKELESLFSSGNV